MIPREATEDLPGRIARLAHGRLPLLDALQRRWGPSAADWPGASELPLVAGSTRTRETEPALPAGGSRPYAATSAGTLSVVQARPAPGDIPAPNTTRGASDGPPVPAVAPAGVASTAVPAAAPSAGSAGLSLLPVVKAGRSPAQWGPGPVLPAPSAGGAPASPAQTTPESGIPLAPAGLQRRTAPQGDRPGDVSAPPEQREPHAPGPAGPARFDAPAPAVGQPTPSARPVVRAAARTAVPPASVAAAPIGPPPAPDTPLRRASETQGEPAGRLPGQPEAGSRAVGSLPPATGPGISRAIQPGAVAPSGAAPAALSGAAPELAGWTYPVVHPQVAPGAAPASPVASILRRAPPPGVNRPAGSLDVPVPPIRPAGAHATPLVPPPPCLPALRPGRTSAPGRLHGPRHLIGPVRSIVPSHRTRPSATTGRSHLHRRPT